MRPEIREREREREREDKREREKERENMRERERERSLINSTFQGIILMTQDIRKYESSI